MSDGADARDFRRKLNVAVGFLRILRNHFRVIGKARLLHPENSRGGSAARRNQIANEQALFWCRIDARNSLGFDNTIRHISRSQCGLNRDTDTLATFHAGGKGFQRFSRDHLLTD